MAKLKSSLLKHAPIVKVVFSVHVRRTDKLKGEAEFHALEEYMNHVADWYPEYVFMFNKTFTQYAKNLHTRISDNMSLEGIVRDIVMLSRCDYLVCTMSSNVCKLAYALMHVLRGDASDRVVSVDVDFLYYVRLSRIYTAMLPHRYPVHGEIGFEVGDVIITRSGRQSSFQERGFIAGRNRRTGKEGWVPKYKLVEVFIAIIDDRHETTLSDRFISLFLCLQTPRVKAEPEDYIIPDISKLKHMSEQSLMQIYWKYINRLQVLCKDIIRVGSLKDGGKEICIDEPYKPKTPCLVYSFGINNQFDFDKDINRLFGCDVYCFDPSMERDSFRVADKIWFYNWGLGGENFINDNGWTIKTLDVIRKELKQTNRPIDVLKIDIEGDEWYTIQQMVSSGALNDVKQISMETHYMPGGKGNHSLSAAEQLYFLRQLYDNGFRIYMRERNLCCTKLWPGFNHNISTVNEISLIKLAQ
ncbi:uncharacterized protein LOC128237688 [Mya arenaria]|uniref:uncharacterized protein LOC128237688 n=1 Tax=Mya arenaria TaxID=6604 RepID=UPI0022E3D327|nr:uncharacterized protein LOC128237688 [Mya arenaria]